MSRSINLELVEEKLMRFCLERKAVETDNTLGIVDIVTREVGIQSKRDLRFFILLGEMQAVET